MFSLNWMEKQFESLCLLSFFSFPFVLLNKPVLLIPREKKKAFNILDICETENSVRPSRNTVEQGSVNKMDLLRFL